LILTNEHVIHGAQSIKVTLSDDKNYTGKLIGKDERTDIAVIKINAGKDITYARLGDSDKIKVGEWVIAVGSPFGLEKTVTKGIVSAKRQSLVIEGKVYHNLIQTDAAINRGNSGGPMFNLSGEVIGINTAIYAPTGVFSGVGFALPINNAKDILESLIHKGKVVRGWIGVEIRGVDAAIAKQFGLPDPSGVLVNTVFDNSPAQKAGLKRGDVIRAVDGKKIDSADELQSIVSHMEPKKVMNIMIIRNKKEMNITLTTGEAPSEEKMEALGQAAAPEESSSSKWQGMKVVTVNSDLARRFNLPQDEKGCVVIDVSQGSMAESMGVMPGDLIKAVNQVPTPAVKEFEAATAKVKLSDGVVLDINRQGASIYLSYSQNE
jgi:Do/DeqQ family serine protease